MVLEKNNAVELKTADDTVDEAVKTESTIVEEVAVVEEPVQKVDFDTWYTVRRGAIPLHHHKEIIKADFTARKVPQVCTMSEFDSALEKYGLKVN